MVDLDFNEDEETFFKQSAKKSKTTIFGFIIFLNNNFHEVAFLYFYIFIVFMQFYYVFVYTGLPKSPA